MSHNANSHKTHQWSRKFAERKVELCFKNFAMEEAIESLAQANKRFRDSIENGRRRFYAMAMGDLRSFCALNILAADGLCRRTKFEIKKTRKSPCDHP